MSGSELVVSCEHGGRDVPAEYAALFVGQEALLDSHRGWDPGALQLARQMADAFEAPMYGSTTTRLLIDLNRSIAHPQLYSEFTRGLAQAQRQDIVRMHYRPHRDQVEGEIAHRIAGARPVIHVASHSFTPVLRGIVRRPDVAWLYDPRRPAEVALVRRWMAALAQRAPGLTLRRNDPYRGRGDGLATLLRRRHSPADYVGIELEVNQRHVAAGAAAWAELRSAIVDSLGTALAAPTPVVRA